MNVPTINDSLTTKAARRMADEYMEALRLSSHDDPQRYHLQTTLDAAKQVAAGRRVLSLVECLRATGQDAEGRPRLCIGRADDACTFFGWMWTSKGRVGTFASNEKAFRRNRDQRYKNRIALPVHTLTAPAEPAFSPTKVYRAVTPTVPAALRPRSSQRLYHLRNYHVLWEATWNEVPTDPLLLRSIDKTGLLYVVLAEWDLTPLERAVLESTL